MKKDILVVKKSTNQPFLIIRKPNNQQRLNFIINLIVRYQKEKKAIEFVNSLSNKKILNNPNYLTFRQYIREYTTDHEVFNNDENFSKGYNYYIHDLENNKDIGPYFFNNEFYEKGEIVLKEFFRQNPELKTEFLEKQTLV